MAKNNLSNTQTLKPTISKEQYNLAKSLVARGTTDAEFQLLIHLANKYQLDPLLKEIWCIKRYPNENALIMTSRDGYLAIAHRSGQFDGLQSGTIEDDKGNLVKAWAEVWRKDMSHSFKAEVRFSEYKQNSPIWQKYPSAMLIKVAEVFALKRAFSISGMLTQEEMGYREVDGENFPQPVNEEDFKTNDEDKKNIDELKNKILNLGEKLGLDEKTTKQTVKAKYDLVKFDELTFEQAVDAIESLKEKIKIQAK